MSVQINYRITWDVDSNPAIGLPGHIELVFDGEDGERRGREHLAILREAEERGMCTNIKVHHRLVYVTTTDWQIGEPKSDKE